MLNDALSADLNAMFLASSMDKTRRYIQSGREYKDVCLASLIQEWKIAFCELVIDAGNENTRNRKDDLDSEFSLRGVDAPYRDDDIKPVFDLYVAESARAIRVLSAARKKQISQQVLDDLNRLLGRDQPLKH